MDRNRGYWWAPDGESLAVARVDTTSGRSSVDQPIPPIPSANRRPMAYPAAGTDNADVTLHVFGLDGGRVDVDWDRDAFPYLADVVWTEPDDLSIARRRA